MDATRRAVITGIGIVSPLGIGIDAHWAGLQAGRSPARRLTLFDTSHTDGKHAAWIEDWQPAQWIQPHKLKRIERYSQFAVVAAHLALKHAELRHTPGQPNPRWGVSLGTALGGFAYGEERHTSFLVEGPSSVPPALGVQGFPASAQGHIAIEFGCSGPCFTNANSCAAGNSALGDALRSIQRGEADVVLAGAAEAPISPLIFKAFDNLGAMSSYDGPDPQLAYRPYHAKRSGFVMGEGAAFFTVESLAHAEARGAAPLAELSAYAITNDAFHMASPQASGESLQRCIRQALSEAGLQPREIQHISAHASGTVANDFNELAQLAAVFGPGAGGISISGTKPYTGHTLGAASAVEAATCILSLRHDWLPATPGLDQIDPAASAFHLLTKATSTPPLQRILSISLGFAGINTAIVLSRPN